MTASDPLDRLVSALVEASKALNDYKDGADMVTWDENRYRTWRQINGWINEALAQADDWQATAQREAAGQ